MNKEDRYRMARARGKKITKYVATGLAAVIFLVCLTGCGGKDSSDTTSSSGRKRAGTVDVERITFKASKYSKKSESEGGDSYAAEFPKGSDYAFLTDEESRMGRRDTGIMVGVLSGIKSIDAGEFGYMYNMTDEGLRQEYVRSDSAEARKGDDWVCHIVKTLADTSEEHSKVAPTEWMLHYYTPKWSCTFFLGWSSVSSDDNYYADEFIPMSPVSEDEFVKEFKRAVKDVAVYVNDELIKPSGRDIF